ncbi:MAG: glycosyltransferase [Frankiales bacterium]|nr:glycosyltransferase [Frankiales bacterium]
MRSARLVSVVVPLLNEVNGVAELYRRTVEAMAELPFELVIVDDGSTDGTADVLTDLAAGDKRLKIVSLSRNFGHQAALTAGLEAATGDAIAMMDGDLQDPPELIPVMLDAWSGGSDVVYAVRTERAGESRFKLATARQFYRLMSKLSNVPLAENSGDFRLLDRTALDALLRMRERARYLRGMTAWIGFTQTAVPYTRDARYAGETKYPLRKMVRFALDAIVSFSHTPLQLASIIGFWVAALAFAAIPVAIVMKATGQFVPGIASVTLAVLLLGGLQLMALGVIGEYVGRIYDEVKRRPLYVVGHKTNFEDGA